MALTYDELVQAIQDYAVNSETSFVANIDTFIRHAEKRIFNLVEHPKFKKNVQGALTANNRFLETPTDFLAPFELSIIDDDGIPHPLLLKEVSWIREAFPDVTDTGIADYYAIFDQDSFILSRTPDQAYSVELHYFAYPQSLVDAGGSNTTWLSTYYDFALLYGALIEAYIYMKGEPDVLQMYEKQFYAAMGMLKELGEGKDRRDTFRTPPMRMPQGSV